MTIKIRPLQSDDWQNYRALRLKSLREEPKAYGVCEEDEANRPDELWKNFCKEAAMGDGKTFMVAETSEGKLIGMLGAIEIFGRPMRHQVEIVQAYVEPFYRRQKLMDRLFTALKQKLQTVAHLEQMIGWVTLHDTQIGKQMFEKWGFTYAGALSKTVKYEGKYYDCCWLEMHL